MAVAAITLAFVALIPHSLPLGALLAACALIPLGVAAVLLLPWERWPGWAQAVPVLVFIPLITLSREGVGAAESGFTPLLLLPVFWFALYGTRVELALSLVATATTLAVPVLAAGGSEYPNSHWSLVVIWPLVAGAIGLTVHALVRRSLARAEELARRNQELEQLQETMEAVARVARGASVSPDARKDICRAAVELGRADGVQLLEPDGAGNLVMTGNEGFQLPPVTLSVGNEPSGAFVAFASKETFFVPDASNNPAVSRRLVEVTGGRSVLFEPVLRGGDAVGVLVVVWSEQIEHLSARVRAAMKLLAAEATTVIDRADLLGRLRELARTDPLTGLPNRRALEEELARELDRARQGAGQLSIAILDLDGFKTFNDRFGHQDGDRLLKSVAAAWRTQLRSVDTLVRWGGDEFAAVLPGCAPEEARVIMERVREATPEEHSCSTGVALWDGRETVDGLLARADAALFEAKAAGRDRTTLAP